LLVVLLVMALASSLALALVLMSALETRAAFNFRAASETLFAADAGIERALLDLTGAADWSAVLDGSVGSTFDDGPGVVRTLTDGRTLNLLEIVNLTTCGHAAACSPAEMDAITLIRPWGPNNPRWRLYLHGTVASLAPGVISRSACYLVVLVADDPSENDNDPLRDGVPGANPGTGVLLVRAEAFGPTGAHKVIEATVVRTSGAGGPPGSVRLLAWREIREPAP
jgi:hypothetical protein